MRAFKIVAMDEKVPQDDAEYVRNLTDKILISLSMSNPVHLPLPYPKFRPLEFTENISDLYNLLNSLGKNKEREYLIGLTTSNLADIFGRDLGVAWSSQGMALIHTNPETESRLSQIRSRLYLAYTTIHEIGHILGLWTISGHCRRQCFMNARHSLLKIARWIKETENTIPRRFYCQKCHDFLLRLHSLSLSK